ncbi:granzyme M [Microcaecilia unicolor]|uniref:Granzyme M n=1 Tax=Microcaecilia unicolor TaxID=1415580 RepID=A0A6P7Y692_9AMPH|nr:granzyme M [Microcaecilia unicolor]
MLKLLSFGSRVKGLRMVGALAMLIFLCTETGGRLHSGIIGGNVAKPHSRPYMVSLQVGGDHFCGGTLVQKQWVLTAAHCFPNLSKGQVTAVLGIQKLSDKLHPEQKFFINGYFPHPHYNDSTKENDIMLLHLARKATLNKCVNVLQLPKKDKSLLPKAICSVAGWGRYYAESPRSDVLRELNVKIMDSRMCNNSRFWNKEIVESMICIQAENSAPCKGDSGGPLVCGKGILTGVISFGPTTCRVNKFKPAVMTAVSKFIKWIKKIMA